MPGSTPKKGSPGGGHRGTPEPQCELHEIMEDAIISLAGAKGVSQYDQIMQDAEASLDRVLGDDTTTKDYCKRVLKDPEDPFVLHEVQMASRNKHLRHFLCIHGYELGIKGLRG